MDSTLDLIDTAVITGGAGGIGKSLASHLISQGKKVMIAGRTESSMQTTAKEIGAEAYYVLNTGDISSISSFTQKLIKEHPNVNCLINNAGVPRPLQFPGVRNRDYGFDLHKANQEININIRGPMHLCIELLPHFTSLPHDTKSVIINVTSVLGYSPSSVINPVYNGTKAWLHSFTMNLRTQLKESGKVKVVEIVPPMVETELHRERKDPKDNSKEKSNGVALSLDEFMDEVASGLREGKDAISAGPGKKVLKTWEEGLGGLYENATAGKSGSVFSSDLVYRDRKNR